MMDTNTNNPNTKSKAYQYYLPEWEKIETIMGGETAVKASGQTYLPKLSGQTTDEYRAYLKRGSFFNAFARTVIGLTGAAIRKEPQIKTATLVDKLLPSVTLTGESIQEVIRIVIQNLIQNGYYGILVDTSEVEEGSIVKDNKPYFAMYPASSIINFKLQQIGNDFKLSMLCLAEKISKTDPANRFGSISVDAVRVLEIEDGKLVVRLFQKMMEGRKEVWSQVGGDIYPAIRGKSWTEIPFVFFGCISNNPHPDQPPLMDMANLNIKHWQVSTDYFHGLHYCALPTPYAAGFPKSADLYIGSQKAWISEDAQAKCGYLEFTGQGLAPVEKALDRLEQQMAVLGARLLEDQKKAAEAAETVRMRFSGDNATLSSIVNSAEQGIIKCLNFLARWCSTDENAEVKLNRDFVSEKLSAQDITALLGALQGGGISQDTFLYNLQVGEILPADRTISEEKVLIESQKERMETETSNVKNENTTE